MSALLPKQTLLTREQLAQQNWQGHALKKAKGEQRWVRGDHCNRGALFCTARTPREKMEDWEGIRKKQLSVSPSGHHTERNISFLPSPSPTHLMKALVTVQATHLQLNGDYLRSTVTQGHSPISARAGRKAALVLLFPPTLLTAHTLLL